MTIHQPNYIPWLGFFDKMARADICISLDCVQYTKGGFSNRNYILGPQGPLLLTVPVHGHFPCLLSAVAVDNTTRWAEKHYRSFEQCYRKAPRWREHEPFLRSLYLERRWERLVDLNETIIRYLFGCLSIDRQPVSASRLTPVGAASDLLLDLVQRAGGDTYLSGPSGRSYLNEERFARAGVRVIYHEFQHPVYPKAGAKAFVSNLSAFDLVMNSGPGSPGGALCGQEPVQAPEAPPQEHIGHH